MARDMTTAPATRCLTVWLAVTAAAAACWWLAVPVVDGTLASGRGASFADLLVALCAAALLAATGWLWVVATHTVGGLLLGRVPAAHGGLARRLVLVACGAALAAGMASPATAAGGDSGDLLAGLSLPDRASAPAAIRVPSPVRPDAQTVRAAEPAEEEPQSPVEHVVAPGDSLWSIAQDHHRPGSDIDAEWRRLWQHNRDVIGDDPDLILPGQRLRLPDPHPADAEGDQR